MDQGPIELATADTYSSILKENVFALTTSGSGPRRVSVSSASIAEIPSAVSVKLKDVEVLGDTLRMDRFWNNRESVLDVPARHNLRGRLLVLFCKFDDGSMRERVLLVARRGENTHAVAER